MNIERVVARSPRLLVELCGGAPSLLDLLVAHHLLGCGGRIEMSSPFRRVAVRLDDVEVHLALSATGVVEMRATLDIGAAGDAGLRVAERGRLAMVAPHPAKLPLAEVGGLLLNIARHRWFQRDQVRVTDYWFGEASIVTYFAVELLHLGIG